MQRPYPGAVPSGSTLLAFTLVSLALIVIPGPSVLFVIARSIANGRIGGVVSALGNGLGGLVLVGAVSLGLGTLLATSEALFTVVKLIGACYLVLLGVQAIRHRKRIPAAPDAPRVRSRTLLSQGLLVGASNPKTAVFFAAVLPQFVDRTMGTVPLQLLTLGIVFLLIAVASDSVWALTAGTARGWFARSPKRIQRLDAAGGVTMIGLGGVIALSGRAA